MKKPEPQGTKKHTAIRPPRRGRSDDANAFFPDPGTGPARSGDPLAQELAEEYLQSATTAEEAAPDRLDEEVAEEEGGPFVVSPASREYARDTDASNPQDAEAEPLPSPMRGVR